MGRIDTLGLEPLKAVRGAAPGGAAGAAWGMLSGAQRDEPESRSLVEKLLARQAGIDDRALEPAKVAVMRSGDAAPVPGRQELRLVGEKMLAA